MSDYYDLVQWQEIDPSNNLVKPWFTHPFLEELATWDLKGKYILEYGGGKSSPWWREKSWYVATVETIEHWADKIKEWCNYFEVPGNGDVMYRPVNEGERDKEEWYVKAGDTFVNYDIVVVDGIFRYECMVHAIELLKDRGGKIIVDNWDQDGFLCPACVELMATYEGHIYPQPDHTDHHGNCWKTAYFVIPPQ